MLTPEVVAVPIASNWHRTVFCISVNFCAGRGRARSRLGLWMGWICTPVSTPPHFHHHFNQQSIQNHSREICTCVEQDHDERTYILQNNFLLK
jgi:hypothetical protein